MFGVELAGLFKHPAICVGVISRFVGGAMNLARPIKYLVQTRWTIFISSEWLLPLTGFGATESDIHRRVFCMVSTLVLVASWFAIAVSDFRSAWVAGAIASTSKPAIFSCAKTGHKCGEGSHGLWFFLAEMSGKPLVSDTVFEGREGFNIRTIHNLVLFD